ncbi:hypothetical protein Nmel_016895, partial [Mimus melanotis]
QGWGSSAGEVSPEQGRGAESPPLLPRLGLSAARGILDALGRSSELSRRLSLPAAAAAAALGSPLEGAGAARLGGIGAAPLRGALALLWNAKHRFPECQKEGSFILLFNLLGTTFQLLK